MKILLNYQDYLTLLKDWIWAVLPHIVIAAITLFLGIWIIRLINNLVHKFFLKKDYDPTLETFLQSFINIALKALLFVLVVTELGVQSSSLVAIVGAAGLAVGLALQGSLSNFAGGMLILIFKPFKVGDFIVAQGVEGTVREITIFTTKLNTFGNQTAIVPNGELSNNNIINYNTETTRRDKITVGIGYSSDLKRAKAILLELCAQEDRILKDPAPVVFVGELADSSVNLSLRFWTANSDFWDVHSDIQEQLKYAFDAEGIEIPFPQRVIHKA